MNKILSQEWVEEEMAKITKRERLEQAKKRIAELEIELQTVLNCLDWVVTDRDLLRTNTAIVLKRLVDDRARLQRQLEGEFI